MSKLFDDASLAMIPSAYKDGKLYSIRPTDGSGDFTFSRGSNLAATRVDVNGLIEKGRENLVPHSNTFSSWNATALLNTPTTGITGYDGSNNAWKIIPNTTNTSHRVWYPSLGLGDSVYTFSVYAKSGGYSSMYLYCNSTGADFAGWFDLSTGTTGSGTGLIDTTISDVGNGWYRCTLTGLEDLSSLEIYVGDGTESIVFAGDGTSSLYIQDAQLEQGLVATDYIETGTSAAQSGILEDMPRLDYSGSCPALLLEPQRTNILAYSEGMFDSSNFNQINGISVEGQQTDLNGTNTAVKLSNFVQFAARLDYNTAVAAVDGKTYTYSAYYKGSGDIRINVSTSTGVGGAGEKTITLTDEWVRHSITTTFSSPTGNVKSHLAITRTANNDAEVYMCFAQIEEGSYPTSYIPTYGTSQTRSRDYRNLDNLISLGIINNDTFTYFIELNCENIIRDSSSLAIQIGSSSQRILFYNSSSTAKRRFQMFIQDGTTETYTLSTDIVKICISVQPNSVKVFENGVNVLSTTQNLDLTSNSDYKMYGDNRAFELKQDMFFPTALTDSECIALTTL